jgi:hypothetical protein
VFKEIKVTDLFTNNFEQHEIEYNIYKIALFLCENNSYYADLLLEKNNIVELYTKYLYKLVINYKN